MNLHSKIQQLKSAASVYPVTTYKVPLELRAKADDTSREVAGYLAVFGVPDDYGTVFVKGAFAKSIAERGPASQSKQKIAFLWQHDCCDPIGQFTELIEDDYGLRFKALCDAVEQGDRALLQIRSGTLNQFSVGFKYLFDKMEYVEETETILIKEVEMWEGSVVTLGSNPETYAIRSKEELEQRTQDLFDETESFIRTVPRHLHLELRQLIKRHKTLAAFQPEAPLKALAEPPQNVLKIGGYNLDTKQFK